MSSESTPGLPGHVAIVMDGNGRWAKRRFLPRLAGHRQGAETLRKVVRWSIERGIRTLTVFAFSSENWSRPEDEVSGLMSLFSRALVREVPELDRQNVKVVFPGDCSVLSPAMQDALLRAESDTAKNDRLTLNICFNYGGRWDIVQAAKKLVQRGEAITESALASELSLAHVPDPDLLIRTGGELRISNFLLWQMAYSEFYFSDKLWPEFDEAEFDKALRSFTQRERRFGQTSEQLDAPPEKVA